MIKISLSSPLFDTNPFHTNTLWEQVAEVENSTHKNLIKIGII